MNLNDLITFLREKIEETNIKCFSPDLPQNEELCCAIQLMTGNNIRSLSQNILYSEIPFYILIRGNLNDKETRAMTDKIFNHIDMITNIGNDKLKIILISCDTPNYAFRDENQRIHYNINCRLKVEWRNI